MPYGPLAASRCADEYEWNCSVADCVEHSHDEDDFFHCEACHGLVCFAHVRHGENDFHHFCQDCFVCSVCGEAAAVVCEECGDLLCLAHSQSQTEQVDEWNCSDPHYHCSGLCQMAQKKPVAAEILREKREVI